MPLSTPIPYIAPPLTRARTEAFVEWQRGLFAERGWRLGSIGAKGYATEAARAVLAFGFDELSLAEIVSFTSVANARSRRVMERIGMKRDAAGDFEHPNVPEGNPLRPHVLYRLQAAARETA